MRPWVTLTWLDNWETKLACEQMAPQWVIEHKKNQRVERIVRGLGRRQQRLRRPVSFPSLHSVRTILIKHDSVHSLTRNALAFIGNSKGTENVRVSTQPLFDLRKQVFNLSMINDVHFIFNQDFRFFLVSGRITKLWQIPIISKLAERSAIEFVLQSPSEFSCAHWPRTIVRKITWRHGPCYKARELFVLPDFGFWDHSTLYFCRFW